MCNKWTNHQHLLDFCQAIDFSMMKKAGSPWMPQIIVDHTLHTEGHHFNPQRSHSEGLQWQGWEQFRAETWRAVDSWGKQLLAGLTHGIKQFHKPSKLNNLPSCKSLIQQCILLLWGENSMSFLHTSLTAKDIHKTSPLIIRFLVFILLLKVQVALISMEGEKDTKIFFSLSWIKWPTELSALLILYKFLISAHSKTPNLIQQRLGRFRTC